MEHEREGSVAVASATGACDAVASAARMAGGPPNENTTVRAKDAAPGRLRFRKLMPDCQVLNGTAAGGPQWETTARPTRLPLETGGRSDIPRMPNGAKRMAGVCGIPRICSRVASGRA